MAFEENISNQMEDSTPEKLIRDIGNSELHLRRRVPVGILGATGSVGQKFIELLRKHPWFEITALSASEKSNGKTYKEAVKWLQPTPIPAHIAKMPILPCEPNLDCKIVFSALDSTVAGTIEQQFAEKGYIVVSNAKNHRMDPDVPLLIPEVNLDHLALVKCQKFPNGGMIVTNPNCAAIGLAIALRPLVLEFGVESAHVVTLQSTSGAGFPGVPSLSVLDNVIPYIAHEEEKLETEPKKLFGSLKECHIEPYPIAVSAQVFRVPVTEGHTEAVSVKLGQKTSIDDIKRAWKEFWPPVQELHLPSSPTQIIHYFEEDDYPQPKLHKDLEQGMAVSIGKLQKCSVLDYKFVFLSHNTVRGAAGGSILIGEALVKQGYVYW